MKAIRRSYWCGIFIVVLSLSSSSILVGASSNSHETPSIPQPSNEGKLKKSQIWDNQQSINGIWGDETHLYTAGQSSEFETYGDLVVCQWDKKGNLEWKIPVPFVNRTNKITGMWGNHECVFVCGKLWYYADAVPKDEGHDGFISVIGKEGSIRWSRFYNSSRMDEFYGVWSDEDSLYTMGAISNETYDNKLLLIKWDFKGDIVWKNTYEFQGGSWEKMRFMGDGEYLYAVHSRDMMKWYKNGTQLFFQTKSITLWSDIWVENNTIVTVSDSYYGYPAPNQVKDVKISKWNSEGVNIWNQSLITTIGEMDPETFPLSKIWGNGMDVFLCEISLTISGYYDLILSKFDETGINTWNKSWERPDTYEHYEYESMWVWGDEQSIYMFGEIHDPDTNDEKAFFLQWDINNTKLSIPTIIGITIGGLFMVLAFSWILVKRIHKAKSIQS